MNSPAIEVNDLTKAFDGVVALAGISFSVAPGETLAILGPNGAGKTTTINILTTLTAADSGRAVTGGFDLAARPAMVRGLIGVAGQETAVDEILTARENLRLFGRLSHLSRDVLAGRVTDLLRDFDMEEIADRPARTYSGGERRRLHVAAALIANPQILFLDEPTVGLDPRARNRVRDEIRRLAAAGVTIVLTTQYLEEADQLADRILLLDRGRIVAAGTPDELKDSLERDILEIEFAGAADLAAATEPLAALNGPPTADAAGRRLSIRAGEGAATALAALRILDSRDIVPVDFQLRRPTLDDVFLSLAGAPAEPASGAGSDE
jgi:ABC-2 type transport system ATP-binding protein